MFFLTKKTYSNYYYDNVINQQMRLVSYSYEHISKVFSSLIFVVNLIYSFGSNPRVSIGKIDYLIASNCSVNKSNGHPLDLRS